jgi:hypothetical protein
MRILLYIVLLFASFTGHAQHTGKQVDSFMTALYANGQFSGAMIVAVKGKPIFQKGFGLSNRKLHKKFSVNTPRYIGSLSKQFTGIGVAIFTSARSLLETVCRHIIEVKGIELDDSADLPKVYKTAVTQLNLSPEQHTQPVFKQILSGCQSVVEGLGSLRNKYSDAHGKGPRAIKPSERHAALAVNLAGAMSSFMLATLESSTDSK